MRSLFEGSLFRPAGVVYGNQNSVYLKEHDKGAKLRELVITGLPTDSYVYDLDPVEGMGSGKKKKLKRYSWFFSGGHPIAGMQCDGALNFSYQNLEYLILLEMKSSLSGVARGRQQLNAGRAFATYIESLLNRPLQIRTRLIYIGAPLPAQLRSQPFKFTEHLDMPISDISGRGFISFSQLAA